MQSNWPALTKGFAHLVSLADLLLQPWLQCVQLLTCFVHGGISRHPGFQPEPVGFGHLPLGRMHLPLQRVHLLLQLLALQVRPCPVLRRPLLLSCMHSMAADVTDFVSTVGC